jgi:8-oxo-dGTP diphosphatase
MSKDDLPSVIMVSRCFIINDGHILVVRRSKNNYRNSGQWEVPGGKLKKGEDLHDTLIREVTEETGLLIEPIGTIVHSQSYTIQDGKFRGLAYIAQFGISLIIYGSFGLSGEHDDFRWCSYTDLMNLLLTKETRRAATALEALLKQNISSNIGMPETSGYVAAI